MRMTSKALDESDRIQDLLQTHRVDLSKFGKGNAKTPLEQAWPRCSVVSRTVEGAAAVVQAGVAPFYLQRLWV